MQIIKLQMAIAFFMCLIGCSSTVKKADIQSFEPVSLVTMNHEGVMGEWYEVGHKPMPFNKKCASDSRVSYKKQEAEQARLLVYCQDKQGNIIKHVGKVTWKAPSDDQITVQISGETEQYMILLADSTDLNEVSTRSRISQKYHTLLIGSYDRERLWLLSREPRISYDMKQKALAIAEAAGFKLTDWRELPHSVTGVFYIKDE